MGGDPRARGTSNADSRGSSYQRRRRRQAVLDRDGNGTWALCVTCPTVVDMETMRLDRVLPGFLGGTYALGNVPARGYQLRRAPGLHRVRLDLGGHVSGIQRVTTGARPSMSMMPDLVVAFPWVKRSPGTNDAMRQAREAGIKVHKYPVVQVCPRYAATIDY